MPVSTYLPTRGWFEDDWRARPTPQRPWPVVLLHGTSVSNGDWLELSTQLRKLGWVVFAPAYGQRATSSVPDSAEQVAAYIRQVLAATGAEKVILVGHSQGGLIARWCAKFFDIPTRHIICLSTPNHGTSLGGMLSSRVTNERRAELMKLMIDNYFGPAGMQQIAGSEVLEQLNADGDLLPGVMYTCLATKTDTTVVPSTSCFLEGAENSYVQDFFPHVVVLHENMPHDRRVRSLVVGEIEQHARLSA